MADEDVVTHPYGTKPSGALQVTELPPSSPDVTPIGAAPAPDGSPESRGDGGDLLQDRGTPEQIIQNTDPAQAHSVAMQSAQAVSNVGKTADNGQTRAQKRQVNDTLKAQGIDPEAAFDDMVKKNLDSLKAARNANKISPKVYKGLRDGWKNLFNIVPKEDFGLFMMDFGFRLMAAGENMTLGGALGTAGAGALQGALGRQTAREEQAAADTAAATKMATERYGAISGRISAEAQAQRAAVAGGGYQGEKAWLLSLGRAMGKSDQEVWDMFNKVKSSSVRRQELLDFILAAKADASITDEDPVLGKKYRDFTKEDLTKWVDEVMKLELEGQQSALTPESAVSTALDKYGET